MQRIPANTQLRYGGGKPPPYIGISYFRSCQKATALAAATFRESTP